MRKYFEIFRFNVKSEMNFKVDYVFRLLSYAIFIFIFNALWEYILKDRDLLGYTKSQIIWYIVVGEYILYCIGKKNYKQISEMIKNGDVANILTKPLSLMKYVISLEATSVVDMVVNLFFGTILGLIVGGNISVEPIQILLFFISLILSLILVILLYVFIGMMAFFTEENESFYLIVSKAKVLLVLTPLDFFSTPIQAILKFLPTTYVIYPPGRILVNYDLNNALYLIFSQIIALIVVFLVTYFINLKGVKKINVNGG